MTGHNGQAPIPSTGETQRLSRRPSGREVVRVDSPSVARVRPRTSKGITDLLSLLLVRLATARPSKKSFWVVVAGEKKEKNGRNRTLRTLAPLDATTLTSRPESRSLSELTRQIAPPTKNGHAPPPTESRKSSQSVNPYGVRAG